MYSPGFLARVGLGLAAETADAAIAIPMRAWSEIAALPTLPVRLAGSAVEAYLHTEQRIAELAIRGDEIVARVVPARAQPSWVTFDEDAEGDEDDAEVVVYVSDEAVDLTAE